ncbi:MAG: hypothetical protein HYX53_16455 [Chloroflexi bacterium]|nr:hypothetical protein [Chloroflexota bacterium]
MTDEVNGQTTEPISAPFGEAVPMRPIRRENALFAWARAIVLGVQDTAKDVVDEGRRGAHEAYDAYWRRYEAKTKHRRR